jgi:hypothetical protein
MPQQGKSKANAKRTRLPVMLILYFLSILTHNFLRPANFNDARIARPICTISLGRSITRAKEHRKQKEERKTVSCDDLDTPQMQDPIIRNARKAKPYPKETQANHQKQNASGHSWP